MGPRKATGWVTPPGLKASIEIMRTPKAIGGMIMPSTIFGCAAVPSMRGIEWPYMSASTSPTARPMSAIATARFAVTDDFPTPPLPDAIA